MIALALLATLFAPQDSTPGVLSPRARAMLDRFPLPRPGEVMVTTRFSRDTVWVGEQVELVTVAWFPRQLRDRLHDSPSLTAPSLSGLWSMRADVVPLPAGSRLVGGQFYDIFVSDQTIFPLGPGRIETPPAVLTYSVPTSASFFAVQDRRRLTSQPAVLVARATPAAVRGGPTAHGLHAVWRGPAEGFIPGVPAIVELVVSGEGNLTLWPDPDIAWPADVHVYPEAPVEEEASIAGLVAGDKRFRYTIVADSAGVLTLPAVRYLFFDPGTAAVETAVAPPFTVPVLPTAAPSTLAPRLPVTGDTSTGPVTWLVESAWPLVLLLAFLPAVLLWLDRRRPPAAIAVPRVDAELELRNLLGTPLDAGPERVAVALRQRGVARDDAEHVRRWLAATNRRRYGAARVEPPAAPPAVDRVLTRLRHGITALLLSLVLLHRLVAQDTSGVARYLGGDLAGAARAFATAAAATPGSADAWRDLGTARFAAGDQVGAAAAWIRALQLSPRDALADAAWDSAATIPEDVRNLAPSIPLSRDELVILVLAAWWISCAALRWRVRWLRGIAPALTTLLLLALVIRSTEQSGRQALVRAGAVLRVSPTPTAPVLGEAAEWSRVAVDPGQGGWRIVRLSDGRRGWLPVSAIAAIGPLD
ncbi:MAG TPA: hypothetical protein VHW65_10250 [Gemmatimonadales bacterium]|nr:hypothetical protein [Gemmatimonadales bacterium]